MFVFWHSCLDHIVCTKGTCLKNKWFLGFGAAALALGTVVVLQLAQRSRVELPVFGQVSSFELTERSGRAYSSKEMAGRVTIINFFFTTCTGPCPRMNGRVAELYRKFATSDRVGFVSISVDPDQDSLSALREYAKKLGVTDDRWLFVRGPGEEVHRISEEVFHLAGEMPSMHSTKLILVDGSLRVRGYYSSEDEDALRVLQDHVRALLEGS